MNPLLFAFKIRSRQLFRRLQVANSKVPHSPFIPAFLALVWALGNPSEMTGRDLVDPIHAVIRGLARVDPIAVAVGLTPFAAATGHRSLLREAWLGRWQRSHAKFPEGLAPSAEEAFAEKALQHPQFC